MTHTPHASRLARVLVFPCGSEIGLEIHRALKYVKGVELVGLSSVPDHGRYVYSRYVEISSMVGDPDFLPQLRRIVAEWEIDYIYPAFDTVIEALAGVDTGATVIGSPARTSLVTRSKSKTYAVLGALPFVPRTYVSGAVPEEAFPVFIKPDAGYGSRGICLAHDRRELEARLADDDDVVIVEYLPGAEFTVDCFTDRHGRLRFIGPRTRRRIKSGIAVDSTTVPLTEEFSGIAAAINAAFEFRGQWFFQVKQDVEGDLKLLEVAPRVAGTMNLYRVRGVNLAQLTLLDQCGFDVDVLDNGFTATVDRALSERHDLDIAYDAVYVDLDDTLVVDGAVNLMVLALLHQTRQAGKRVILITRHARDPRLTLAEHAISELLFDEVIHLKVGELKSGAIHHDRAVFIDDSFRERKDVHAVSGAAVFDVDAAEALLDWRR